MKKKILVVDDEDDILHFLDLVLSEKGYRVETAANGHEALTRAQLEPPDLVLLDIMMPGQDGFQVCRKLRASFRTRHIPIILLTAKSTIDDRLFGLEGGANDYITKPWQSKELLLRVRNVLEWSRQQRAASPLTGLPGNVSINEEITRRIGGNQPFAMIQVDIDYFKAFNDHYGYARGDDAIKTVARILMDASTRFGGEDYFVGHIGGDDFVILTEPDRSEDIAEEVIDQFNQAVATLYDPEDRKRGFVEVRNRLHNMEHFPLMSLTLALVSTDRFPVSHLAQLIDIAHELKTHGKGIPGSVLVGERRRRPGDAREVA